MFLAKIKISLRPGVLDPQGVTVQQALRSLDYQSVQDVKVGKYLEIRMEAASLEAARQEVEDMCARLLANPVIEDYQLEVVTA